MCALHDCITVKFDTCNNVWSSVHAVIILRTVSLKIKWEYYILLSKRHLMQSTWDRGPVECKLYYGNKRVDVIPDAGWQISIEFGSVPGLLTGVVPGPMTTATNVVEPLAGDDEGMKAKAWTCHRRQDWPSAFLQCYLLCWCWCWCWVYWSWCCRQWSHVRGDRLLLLLFVRTDSSLPRTHPVSLSLSLSVSLYLSLFLSFSISLSLSVYLCLFLSLFLSFFLFSLSCSDSVSVCLCLSCLSLSVCLTVSLCLSVSFYVCFPLPLSLSRSLTLTMTLCFSVSVFLSLPLSLYLYLPISLCGPSICSAFNENAHSVLTSAEHY